MTRSTSTRRATRPTGIIRIAALAVTIAPLVACGEAGDRAPTAPPLATAAAAGATQEKGEGAYVVDATFFFSCVGERIHERTVIPFRYHATTTPSGNTVFVDQFIPGAGTSTIVGLTTGTVWTLRRVVSPEVIRTTAGELFRFTANIWYESETAPTLHIHSQYQIVQNAHGEITAEKNNLHCEFHRH